MRTPQRDGTNHSQSNQDVPEMEAADEFENARLTTTNRRNLTPQPYNTSCGVYAPFGGPLGNQLSGTYSYVSS